MFIENYVSEDGSAEMLEVDHETKQIFSEKMHIPSEEDIAMMSPSEQAVSSRLTTPIVNTYIDTKKICFER